MTARNDTASDAPGGLEQALRSIPVAVARFDLDLRVVWASRRYAEWLGSDGTLSGRPFAELARGQRLERAKRCAEAVRAGRPLDDGELELRHPRLGLRWAHFDCVATTSSTGTPDGWIEAITDVTERHRAEERLHDSEDALKSFYQSSPFFMGIAELEGDHITLLYTNHALARTLNIPAAQMTRRNADDFATPEEAKLWVESYRRCRTERAPVQFEYQRWFDSRMRWLRASVAFICDVAPGVWRFSFIAEEVTEQKQVIEELREANRSKDEFLAMLGHELRNPLAPIVTALELLKTEDHDHSSKTLAIVERQVDYLIRLVDDLLDVARITRGNIQMKKRLLRMQDVIAQAAEMAMPLIEERRHHLEVRLPPAELRVEGDDSRLAQVIANLLTNAAKYTEPGGHILVEAERREDQVVVRVSDNGIGISPQLLPHVFDLFTQERQAADRKRGGLGIGLTIVRSFVERHGGTVRAESAGPGKGSVFTVTLPAATREPAAVEFVSSEGTSVSEQAKRILVVDDNEDALELLAEVLRTAGNEVKTAHDGPSALEAIKDFAADVAVLDIGLPVMDGYELARRLRHDLGDAAPRLIALTGYGQESDRARAKEAGFALHLTKPVDVGCLLGALDLPPPWAGAGANAH